MDGELLQHLYHELFHVGKPHRPARCTYGDNIILFMFFIAVVGDRSLRWAHDRRKWPLWARRLPRPSYSQFKRRVKTDSIRNRIADVNQTLRERLPQSSDKFIDGKPLVVGVFSKDPDAAWGRLSNERWAKGYKVHVLADWTGVIDAFDVTPLNSGEPTTAREIVAAQDLDGAIVHGDAAYDSNALYKTIATCGGRLITPRKKPGTSLGHHPQHPDRLRAIAELRRYAWKNPAASPAAHSGRTSPRPPYQSPLRPGPVAELGS